MCRILTSTTSRIPGAFWTLGCCAALSIGCEDGGVADGFGGSGGMDGLGGSGEGDGRGRAGDPNELVGEYILVESDGYTPLEDTNIRISFSKTELGFSAGCNHHQGEYSLRGDDLMVDAFGATEIGCEQALAAQDTWLAGFFTSEPTIEAEGDLVRVTGGGATLVFQDTEVAIPDLPLIGTTWTIDTLIEGDAAMGGFSNSATVVFSDDYSFTIDGPCNTAQGTFEATEASSGDITFGMVAFTKAGCTEAGDADFQSHLQQVFAQGAATYEIDETRLVLDHGDVGIRARAEQ